MYCILGARGYNHYMMIVRIDLSYMLVTLKATMQRLHHVWNPSQSLPLQQVKIIPFVPLLRERRMWLVPIFMDVLIPIWQRGQIAIGHNYLNHWVVFVSYRLVVAMIIQLRYRQMVRCGHGAAIPTVNLAIASTITTTMSIEMVYLHRCLKGPLDADQQVWH